MYDKDPTILLIQYHCCWWHGNTGGQSISNNDIEQVKSRQLGPRTQGITDYGRMTLPVWRHISCLPLLLDLACCIIGTKPLSESTLTHPKWDKREYINVKFHLKYKYIAFSWRRVYETNSLCSLISPLPTEYRDHIWQVSPQLISCGDTCHIWMRVDGFFRLLDAKALRDTPDGKY